MSRYSRIRSEAKAGWHSFLRRRTAVFFTFFFPVILVVIFGALVETQQADGGLFGEPSGGLFAEPAAYYIAAYLATVVIFTPLSRIGSEIARYREHNRFEKLATTPLSRGEWLLAHTIVNTVIISAAGALILGLVLVLTDASVPLSVELLAVVPLTVFGVVLFCGFGAVLGRLADSQDGVIAASNAIALPLLFLSDTFIPLELLPDWFVPLVDLSPLSYFARGVRSVTYPAAADPLVGPTIVLFVLAIAFFVAGALSIPTTES